jgi:hypothetical protein
MATLNFRKKGEQFFDNAGAMLEGGKIYYYTAGTTNLRTTYLNAAGSTPNTNPLVLDGYGRTQEAVYFDDGADYKEVIKTADDVTLVTMDNIPAADPVVTTPDFAALKFPWSQFTTAQSPIALVAADLGKALEGDTTLGNIEADLPAAVDCADKGFLFKKTAAANQFILDPNGAETIDNAASFALKQLNETLGLFSNGAEWYKVFHYFPGSINIQPFTASGTYTPSPGMSQCIAISTGAGGGGGGADSTDGTSTAGAGGGGAGSTCIELFTAAQIGASQAVAIGAAGAAGAVTGGTGGTGGDTTFGAFHTAGGGSGGVGATGPDDCFGGTGGAGGTATGGLINIPGGGGQGGTGVPNNAGIGGMGGASLWGGGGVGPFARSASLAGGAASAYGAGGGGAFNNNNTSGVLGGVGAPGFCAVIEFILP